jgi:hypothetical protein
MGTLGIVLGSAGTLFSALLFFMLTAFGGGGLVAPGRPPLSKGVERYLNLSLLAGPVACVALGLAAWITGRAWFYAGPPLLVAAQVAAILRLYGRR